MSTFDVRAVRVTIQDHPNADLLEVAQIDGYQCVVGKRQYQTGDLAIYIPEQAIVPDWLLKYTDLEGRLAGPDHNRVKAIKLRGILSQGLLVKADDKLLSALQISGGYLPEHSDFWSEGRDYAHELGVTKWVPPIPINMSGVVYSCPGINSYTDIENMKKFPDVLVEGEEVVATEKIHGTCAIFYLDRDDVFHVSSKGLAHRGLALEDSKNSEEDSTNVYWIAAQNYAIAEHLRTIRDGGMWDGKNPRELVLYGEISGVQDLKYGLASGNTVFHAFDLRIDGSFVDYDVFRSLCEPCWLIVPELYRGPFSMEKTRELSEGKETVSGNQVHMREGVVVRPTKERTDPEVGRVILKSISEAYLLRKGEVTEFE